MGHVDQHKFLTTVVLMSSATLKIPAAEANRQFSRLLRAVREGTRVIITSHGQPVAEMGPPTPDQDEAERLGKVLAGLEAHWAQSSPVVARSWTRDELYERD